ncbi:MAG: class I SAM-dependent methyltransferase [Clostridia bacterium]|nr:class I SAM-dependent methyltransferase [Clostridia bacterium]
MRRDGRNGCELMAEFFDRRVVMYEEHMREAIPAFDEFYSSVAAHIPATSAPLSILDLGCGTGLELDFVFARASSARITAVDLSLEMLSKLRAKLEHSPYGPQVTIVHGSYLTIPLPARHFDYAISVQTMHHFTPGVKRCLYSRIAGALKGGGMYIEGDYVVSPEEERLLFARYAEIVKSLRAAGAIEEDDPVDGKYHIDIPLSAESQVAVLREAGFADVEVVFTQGAAAVFCARIGLA